MNNKNKPILCLLILKHNKIKNKKHLILRSKCNLKKMSRKKLMLLKGTRKYKQARIIQKI